jgi:hypothetical protein
MSQPNAIENRPTPTIEDYLAIMFIMERDGEKIASAWLNPGCIIPYGNNSP